MLGLASLAFPGAEHSRFAHSVGAAFVMRAFLERARNLTGLSSQEAPSADDERVALAAALTHDLGHGPLSHLFEEVFRDAPPHEHWTSLLLLDPDTQVHRALADVDPQLPGVVERLVHGEHERPWLAHAVSGTFDVDRCDYLLRDSYMTGVRYGLYDLPWLLRSLRLAPGPHGATLAVDGSKGLPAVEGFFLARLFMYQQVYFHKAARAAEVMIRSLFRRAGDLLAEGHSEVGLPPVLLAMAKGRPVSAAEYSTLDDGTLWSTIERWESHPDAILADLAARIRRRALFKTASLDVEQAERAPVLFEALRELCAASGFDPRYYATLDVAEVAPYEEPHDPQEALQVVYQHKPPRPLGRASFLLERLRGESLVLRRLVFPAELRERVTLLVHRSPRRG